jgi:hypothetical protein
MTDTPVDRIYTEFREASLALQKIGEISLSTSVDANSRKAILLAAASYFESKLSGDVLNFCQEGRHEAGAGPRIASA